MALLTCLHAYLLPRLLLLILLLLPQPYSMASSASGSGAARRVRKAKAKAAREAAGQGQQPPAVGGQPSFRTERKERAEARALCEISSNEVPPEFTKRPAGNQPSRRAKSTAASSATLVEACPPIAAAEAIAAVEASPPTAAEAFAAAEACPPAAAEACLSMAEAGGGLLVPGPPCSRTTELQAGGLAFLDPAAIFGLQDPEI